MSSFAPSTPPAKEPPPQAVASSWWSFFVSLFQRTSTAVASSSAAAVRRVETLAILAMTEAPCARLFDVVPQALADATAPGVAAPIEMYVSRRAHHWSLIIQFVASDDGRQLSRPFMIHLLVDTFRAAFEKRWVVRLDRGKWNPSEAQAGGVRRSQHPFNCLQLVDTLIKTGKSFGIYRGVNKNCQQFARVLCDALERGVPDPTYERPDGLPPTVPFEHTRTESSLRSIVRGYGFLLRLGPPFFPANDVVLAQLQTIKSTVKCAAVPEARRPTSTGDSDERPSAATTVSTIEDEDEAFDAQLFQSHSTDSAEESSECRDEAPPTEADSR